MNSGPYGVLLTPFDEAGNIRFDALRKQIDRLTGSGLTGIVICGTTGEFIQMTAEENIALMECAAECANGRLEVIAGACAANLRDTIRLAEAAAHLRFPAVLVCPPYYTPLSQGDIATFYTKLAEVADVNILLYNIPAFTTAIAPDTLRRLIQMPRIIGIKDSSGDMKNIIGSVSLSRRERPDFVVFTGTDQIILPSLAAGCSGSMTALSALLPELNTAIYDAFSRQDWQKARLAQLKTIELLRLAESVVFPAGYKIIGALTGYETGEARQVIPVKDTSAYNEAERTMKAVLKELNIL